jgi:hypothetical protein
MGCPTCESLLTSAIYTCYLHMYLSVDCDLPNLSLVWITVIIFLVLLYSGLLLHKDRYSGGLLSRQTVLRIFLSSYLSSYRATTNRFPIFSHTRPNTVTLSIHRLFFVFLFPPQLQPTNRQTTGARSHVSLMCVHYQSKKKLVNWCAPKWPLSPAVACTAIFNVF